MRVATRREVTGSTQTLVGDTGFELARRNATRSHWFDTNFGGRYWVRTSDLFRVREARYRCANRPDETEVSPGQDLAVLFEVDTGFEPVLTALQAAASPLGQSTVRELTHHLREPSRRTQLERMTRLELATLTLARLCATNCATSACILPNAFTTLAGLRHERKTHTPQFLVPLEPGCDNYLNGLSSSLSLLNVDRLASSRVTQVITTLGDWRSW